MTVPEWKDRAEASNPSLRPKAVEVMLCVCVCAEIQRVYGTASPAVTAAKAAVTAASLAATTQGCCTL